MLGGGKLPTIGQELVEVVDRAGADPCEYIAQVRKRIESMPLAGCNEAAQRCRCSTSVVATGATEKHRVEIGRTSAHNISA